MTTPEALMHAVARQILLGLRESLTIAGQLGQPVEAINAALHQLQAGGDGCLLLSQPFAGEPRLVITVVAWDAPSARPGRWSRCHATAGFTTRLKRSPVRA
jgi:hypothetical protein